MKAKVLVPLDRDAAIEAIRALDALGEALRDSGWPRKLKRQYRHARRDLVDAIGHAALFSGIAEQAVVD
jgi:hypothetical protein